jgi:hypothetical protein
MNRDKQLNTADSREFFETVKTGQQFLTTISYHTFKPLTAQKQ